VSAGVPGGARNKCCHSRTPFVADDARSSTALEVKEPPETHRVPVHCLRHTCVSLLLALGIHPRVVMEISATTPFEMTMNVYGHVNSTPSAPRSIISTSSSQTESVDQSSLSDWRRQQGWRDPADENGWG
jgi:hypothetical protein